MKKTPFWQEFHLIIVDAAYNNIYKTNISVHKQRLEFRT